MRRREVRWPIVARPPDNRRSQSIPSPRGGTATPCTTAPMVQGCIVLRAWPTGPTTTVPNRGPKSDRQLCNHSHIAEPVVEVVPVGKLHKANLTPVSLPRRGTGEFRRSIPALPLPSKGPPGHCPSGIDPANLNAAATRLQWSHPAKKSLGWKCGWSTIAHGHPGRLAVPRIITRLRDTC